MDALFLGVTGGLLASMYFLRPLTDGNGVLRVLSVLSSATFLYSLSPVYAPIYMATLVGPVFLVDAIADTHEEDAYRYHAQCNHCI